MSAPDLSLLAKRRFAPMFVVQFLGAFNDSLFKQGVVLFVTYQLYSDAAREAPLERSQVLVHPLNPPAATVRPSGEIARQVNPPSPGGDESTRNSRHSSSQTRMVPSHPAATSVPPSGE